ncbi:phage major capsid protein [uncultured Brevundimonas sp.]|uniref:phage major capsid protein n=1 Tax=uncultured Brevundimonas sp. TaxID=213418 RepID=UPI0025D7D9B8|nr:phage major capsid protein [uncultured Brevundimonas sp.]
MKEIKSFEDLAGAFGTHHDEVKAGFKELMTKTGEVSARLDDLEQKSARRGGDPAGDSSESLGARFIGQEGVKDFASRNARSDRFAFETKATITSATTNAPGSAGAGVRNFQDPNITPLLRRRPVVRDLLPVIQVSTGAVEVVRVSGRNNNAAPVAEAALKPQSDLQLGLETVNCRVIAHWMKASRQVLEDLPQLRGLIDTELLDGLALAEETQILNGDGTEQNLDGLIPNATTFAAPFTIADPTMLDTLGLALLQSALAEHPATGIIMHPSDWTRITLLKDGDGNYIMGTPGSAIAQRLWGLPVITTQAMAVDSFLVGDFPRAATLYDRWQARVELGTADDDFIRNLVTVLAEERLAQAIKQPKALTYGDFGNVA